MTWVCKQRVFLAAFVIACTVAPLNASALFLVDMYYAPPEQTVGVCAMVEVDLVVSSQGDGEQEFNAIEAILSWDPEVLELLGNDDSNSGVHFLFSGFSDDQDGINEDWTDGNALWSGLISPGAPGMAPPYSDQLLVTTFQFKALAASEGTELAFIPMMGQFGLTRVLLGGMEITGDISGVGVIIVGTCPGDADASGVVDFGDILLVLAGWGPCGECCPEDFSGNEIVDFADLLVILANWGACP